MQAPPPNMRHHEPAEQAQGRLDLWREELRGVLPANQGRSAPLQATNELDTQARRQLAHG